MKINFVELPKMTIEEFADLHNLTMVVEERPVKINNNLRYHAFFDGCEIKNNDYSSNDLNRVVIGCGATPIEAINNYAENIEFLYLIKSRDKGSIKIPRLFGIESTGSGFNDIVNLLQKENR